MCSLNEDDLDVMPEIEIIDETLPTICRKCGEDGSVTLRKKDVYCTNCFSIAVNHKFRASLGKNKTIRYNQKVAVAISGGLASSVLLNFVHNGLNEDSHKKLRIDGVCVYIDEESSEDKCRTNCEFILDQASQYKLPVYITHISKVMSDDTQDLQPNTIPKLDPVLLGKLDCLLKGMTTSTSRIDFLIKLRRKLLVQCAEQLRCCFIFSGESSSKLATNMLSNLVLGRGAQIENDVSFCDSRDSVKILKPMKEVTLEELKYYAKLKNIYFLQKNEIPVGSIQSTIENFVVDLQENFPATVSTICKTGEKIGNSEDSPKDAEDICIICQSTLDTQEQNSSALQATNFSRLVSSTGPGSDNLTVNKPSCGNCNCSKKEANAEQFLCYGCRLIYRDIKDDQVLHYFNNIASTRMAMTKMRNEINDFLL